MHWRPARGLYVLAGIGMTMAGESIPVTVYKPSFEESSPISYSNPGATRGVWYSWACASDTGYCLAWTLSANNSYYTPNYAPPAGSARLATNSYGLPVSPSGNRTVAQIIGQSDMAGQSVYLYSPGQPPPATRTLFNLNNAVYQTLAHEIGGGGYLDYQLQVDVGRRSDIAASAGVTYAVALAAMSQVNGYWRPQAIWWTGIRSIAYADRGFWSTETLSASIPSTYSGYSLGVFLLSYQAQTNFDNVRVSAISGEVPEPSQFLLMGTVAATLIAAVAARRRSPCGARRA
jgi:hypothetical protein